jgi:hypothetical protein
VRRGVGGFDLFEEGGLAGVVEAEEEDGVFLGDVSWGFMGSGYKARSGACVFVPSLLVAWRYMDLKRWYIVWTTRALFTWSSWWC